MTRTIDRLFLSLFTEPLHNKLSLFHIFFNHTTFIYIHTYTYIYSAPSSSVFASVSFQTSFLFFLLEGVMDQGWPVDTDQPGESYALSGKLMLTAVSIFFGVVVFMACLHLYARWYALRLRRHQLESRGQRRNHILLHAAERHPSSLADRGLEPSVLNSLPAFLYSPKAPPLECAVCLSEFEEKEVVRPLPKCGHSFHVECIGMWFHSHSTCPLCRSPVEKAANRSVRSSTAEGSIEEASGSEPNTSSGTGLCTTFQHEEGNGSNTTSFSGRNKGIGGGTLGIRIEAAPPRPAEVNNELNQSSPGTRRLSSKRLLSITRKPSVSFGGTTPQGAAELDLEGGLSEPVRVE